MVRGGLDLRGRASVLLVARESSSVYQKEVNIWASEDVVQWSDGSIGIQGDPAQLETSDIAVRGKDAKPYAICSPSVARRQ